MKIYEFAIKRELLNDNREVFTPLFRVKHKYVLWTFKEEWSRIILMYKRYDIQNLDWDPELTREDCIEHIKGYQEYLKQKNSSKVRLVELSGIEEFTI